MASWPPYRLIQRDYLREAQKQYDKLERIYHIGPRAGVGRQEGARRAARQARRHPPRRRQEAGARARSSRRSCGASSRRGRSAPTSRSSSRTSRPRWRRPSQVFDEARHFYVLRDYLLALDCRDPAARRLHAHGARPSCSRPTRLVDKLLGMQLHRRVGRGDALPLGRARRASSRCSPSSCPTSSATRRATSASACSTCRSSWPTLGPLERTRLKLKQLKIVTLIGWGTHLKKPHFEALGIDNNDGFRRGTRLQREVMDGMRTPDGEDPPGVLVGWSAPRPSSTTRPSTSSFRAWGASRPRGSAPSSASSTSWRRSATAPSGSAHEVDLHLLRRRWDVPGAHGVPGAHVAFTAGGGRRRIRPAEASPPN